MILLCDTIAKGYCAISGGISHWAAKCTSDLTGICYPNHHFCKITDFVAGQAPSGNNYRFQQFSGLALLAGQSTGICLKSH